MRPSSILTFEPEFEHGVPWGRDLFTFVTSAAGHMMRTLQRPCKKKPSKRQVNHRRFLHNMIQRKFAEIEAANHQLASTLFSTDNSQNHLPEEASQIATEVTDKSPRASKKAIDTFINADKTKAHLEQQDDVCELWTLESLVEAQVTDKCFLQCTSLNCRDTNLRTEKDHKSLKNRNQLEHNPGSSTDKDNDFSFERQPASTDSESLTQMTSNHLEDSVSTWFGSIERMRTNSKPCTTKYSDMKLLHAEVEDPDLSPPSPVISLLSLDSCDFEVQMLIDADHSARTLDSAIAEALQMDTVDSFDLLDCCENQDLKIHVHSEEAQSCVEHGNIFPSSLESGYDMGNLMSSDGGTCTQDFQNCSRIITLLENSISSLDQNAQGLSANLLYNQEPLGCSFHQNQINYSTSNNNILEDHFGQLEPSMMTNGKEACYSATGLPVSSQTVSDCIVSSHPLDHHIFPGLENQLDSQTKRILFDTYKSHSQSQETDRFLMLQETDIRNADKNIVQLENLNRSGSGLQCPIMHGSCLEGFCYHKGEFCSYSKFRGNLSRHNFEGVARSFPATLHKIHPTPIPTPPLDDDWLFSNIVADEEVNSTTNTFVK